MICREPVTIAIGLLISVVLAVDHFLPKPELCSVEVGKNPVVYKVMECKEEHKLKNLQKYIAQSELASSEI